LIAFVGMLGPFVDLAQAQIRVVAYNTLGKPSNSQDRSEFETIMEAIGNQETNGIAKRADILGLQEGELTLSNNTFADIAASMNSLYSVSSYQAAVIGTGIFKVGYVYDSSTVDLIDDTAFFIGTRPAHRAQFRPVGYADSNADIYAYNIHLKAGSTDLGTRLSEVINLRANADALGDGRNLIYLGDFNFYRVDEPGFQRLRSSGNGAGVDPIDPNQSLFWPLPSNAEIHTQSTRNSSIGDGGAFGGMDDRFDMQIVSSELLDGEGLSYIGPSSTGLEALDDSYQAFGNDGFSYNDAINGTFVGRSQPAAVLNALHAFSDHLPVVADYQLPASMNAMLSSALPAMINLNDLITLDVLVENIADVVAVVGADELDYTLSVSGDLFGSAMDMDLALGGGKTHPVILDTSSIGLKSGIITVETTSLAAANSFIEIPIDFEVLNLGMTADFDKDLDIDGADFLIWQRGLGSGTTPAEGDADADGDVDASDLATWGTQYGTTQFSLQQAAATVPEPTPFALIGIAMALAAVTRRPCLG